MQAHALEEEEEEEGLIKDLKRPASSLSAP
jgi:hypothetical protein